MTDAIIDQELHNRIADVIDRAYQDAYMRRLRDYGYKVRYKPTFKDKVKKFVSLILTVIVLIVVAYILWLIPPIRQHLIELYNENPFISVIVDIFIKK